MKSFIILAALTVVIASYFFVKNPTFSEESSKPTHPLHASKSSDRSSSVESTIRETRTASEHKSNLDSLWQSGNYAEAEQQLNIWLKQDPGAAFSYVNGLSNAKQARHYAQSLFSHAKLLDFESAWNLSSLLTNQPGIRIDVIADHFSEHLASNRDNALDLLDSLPDEEDSISKQLAYRAARYGSLGESMPAMKALLSEDNTSPLREDLISGTLEHWLATNPNPATDFLNGSDANPLFDRAALTHVKNSASINPKAALTWAQMLVHPSLREEAIKIVQSAE